MITNPLIPRLVHLITLCLHSDNDIDHSLESFLETSTMSLSPQSLSLQTRSFVESLRSPVVLDVVFGHGSLHLVDGSSEIVILDLDTPSGGRAHLWELHAHRDRDDVRAELVS